MDSIGRFLVYLILTFISMYILTVIYSHNGLDYKIGSSNYWMGFSFATICLIIYSMIKKGE